MKKNKDHISFLKIEWSFNSKNWISFNQEDFKPSLVEIDQLALEKVLKSLPYIFTIYYRLERCGPFVWINVNPLYQWIICAKCWKWPSGSWEEGFQMLSMYLCYAFEKGRDRLKKVEFPSLYCQYILRWREFKFLSGFGEKVNAVVNAFSFFFDIYLHSKQMWPFILTNLKSIQPQMLCAKSG